MYFEFKQQINEGTTLFIFSSKTSHEWMHLNTPKETLLIFNQKVGLVDEKIKLGKLVSRYINHWENEHPINIIHSLHV